jgi:protein TonB
MEANKILNADLLDIIFEGKNKSYGAYDLRKSYNARLKKAMIITGSILVLVIGGGILGNYISNRVSKDTLTTQDVELAQVKAEPPPPVVPPPPPPKPPPPPEVNQVKFTPPKIVKDEEVKPEEKIQEVKDDQVISTKTVESDNKTQIVQAPVEDKGTSVVEAPKADDENKVFTKVENEAEFPGGQGAWANYLRKNLNANAPVDNGAPEGTYTVIIRFIVSKDGSISDVTPETKFGYGMEDEAAKIIKKGPRWKPALQNGRNVNAYRRQPITFVVTTE